MSEMPVPPWGRPRKSAPRRTFTQEAVITAALQVIDTEGVDALSMRRVAQELGTGAASLYAHVSGREELIGLVLNRVLAEVICPEPDAGRWQEQIKDILRHARRVLIAHNDLARLLPEIGVPTGESASVAAEGMLTILTAAGLPAQACAYALDALVLYVTAIVAEEAARAGHAKDPGQARENLHTWLHSYYAALPPDRFPVLTGMTEEMTRDVGDERFEFGLDLMVKGLATHAPRG